MDLIIPDELWNEISDVNLLCPTCIVNKLEEHLGYSAFRLVKL